MLITLWNVRAPVWRRDFSPCSHTLSTSYPHGFARRNAMRMLRLGGLSTYPQRSTTTSDFLRIATSSVGRARVEKFHAKRIEGLALPSFSWNIERPMSARLSALPRCSTCRRRPPRPGQRTCTACHAEYMTRWRARQKCERETIGQAIDRLTPEQRDRFLAGEWQT